AVDPVPHGLRPPRRSSALGVVHAAGGEVAGRPAPGEGLAVTVTLPGRPVPSPSPGERGVPAAGLPAAGLRKAPAYASGPADEGEIGRAHVCTPVSGKNRMP